MSSLQPRSLGLRTARIGLFVAALLAGSTLGAAAQTLDSAAAENLLRNAAEAMGGLDLIEGAESMQMFGYSQHADGFGSGNVSGSPFAPQKYGADNDYQLTWDLANDRYMEHSRRYLLFPFASPGAHSYNLTRSVLDGDVPYRLNADGVPSRRGNVREMRMWSLSYNPVAALQAALSDGTVLSDVHVEDGDTLVVDVTLDDGERFTLGFDWRTSLPESLTFVAPNHLLGEVRYTTTWTGYVPYDGIELPLGMVTNWDWRDVDFRQTYVEGWIVNGEIPDLAAAPEIRDAQQQTGGFEIEAEEVSEGVWQLSNGGTAVIEFADHLVLVELGGGGYDDETQPTIEFAETLVPGKPVTHYIATHQHDDHLSGLRTAVAMGLTVIAHHDNYDFFTEVVSRPAPNYPDMLHQNPVPLDFIPVDGHLRLEDETRTLDIYRVVAHNHMASAIFAHDPNNNIMFEGDLFPAPEWTWWPDAYEDNIDFYDIEVDTVVSYHFGVMGHQEALDFLARGRDGVQVECIEQAQAGIYRTGCAPFFTRGGWMPEMLELYEVPFEWRENQAAE